MCERSASLVGFHRSETAAGIAAAALSEKDVILLIKPPCVVFIIHGGVHMLSATGESRPPAQYAAMFKAYMMDMPHWEGFKKTSRFRNIPMPAGLAALDSDRNDA